MRLSDVSDEVNGRLGLLGPMIPQGFFGSKSGSRVQSARMVRSEAVFADSSATLPSVRTPRRVCQSSTRPFGDATGSIACANWAKWFGET
jgi:hypothetical protein